MSGDGEGHALTEAAFALAPDLHLLSLREAAGTAVWLEPDPGDARLERFAVLAEPDADALATAEGERSEAGGGLHLVRGPTSPVNAALLRRLLPHLAPVPLGLRTSAGFGDRLGVATPGHVRALHAADPEGRVGTIFAQQSIREMTRTGRRPQEVLDDATWGAFAAGWDGAQGADADHLKTPADVDACAAAGFTLYTLDVRDHVDDAAADEAPDAIDAKLEALPWPALGTTFAELRRRYENRRFDADGLDVRLEPEALRRGLVKYGRALAHAASMHAHLAGLGVPFEVELSVDESDAPTTLQEHLLLALELRRLEVPLVSLAPRFVGRFEKGVDYRGDVDELTRTLDGHARIARTFGPYKLSLHSGSDKFTVYPLIAEAAGGLVHLKTAGTSYLEALRVAAHHDPELFREVLASSRERFAEERASYHVSARLDAVPAPEAVDDAQLPALLERDDARQVLHVTFGSALDAFRPRLLALLHAYREAHEAFLERHFERHLEAFARVAPRP